MSDINSDIKLFEGALELPESEQFGFIERECGADAARVERLQGLLEGHRRARDDSWRTHLASPPAIGNPTVIGPYRVISRIGEGGMGVVYAAEQREPIRRRVAIKLVKAHADSREVVGRFHAERQALALMNHANIAKILDAGLHDGRPYFVMELVAGLPVTEYCDKRRLGLEERLELFRKICQGVHHAHQKGIIHRDLKPTNILVAEEDGEAVPKIIDFGIAKVFMPGAVTVTSFTEVGRVIGTPDYMSPEQAETTPLDIDTRADVYSLGALLFELITGETVFALAQSGAGIDEVRRVIADQPPPRPSSKFADSTPTVDERASQRASTPEALARRCRQDLDWITLKAIEKEPSRRYASADELASDVGRFIAGEPVVARPPNAAYQLRKFVTRHRYITFAVASAVFAVAVGVAGLTIGLINAHEARALADRRADHAQVAADFLQTVLFHVDPEFGGGKLSLLEVMDIASQSIEGDLHEHPEVEASVRESMGVAYRRLSKYLEAEPHLRESVRIRRELLGDGDLHTARSLIAMAYLRFEYQGDVDQALQLLSEATASYEAQEMTSDYGYAWVLLDIGLINLAGDHLAEAEQAFSRSQELLSEERGADHSDISRPLRGLAMVALRREILPKAERLGRDAMRLCEGEGTEYIGARAKLVLAQVLIATGQLDEAAALLSEAQGQFARTVGPDHARMAELDACLAELHLAGRAYSDAERIAARCEIARRQILHPEHWAILEARLLRQRALIGLGHTAAAEGELLLISGGAERLLGEDHPLSIAIADARLECARAMNDDSLQVIRAERLERMRQRRADRLEKTEASNAQSEAGRHG